MNKNGIIVLIFFAAVFLLITGIKIFVTGEMPIGKRSGYEDIGNISYLFGGIFPISLYPLRVPIGISPVMNILIPAINKNTATKKIKTIIPFLFIMYLFL